MITFEYISRIKKNLVFIFNGARSLSGLPWNSVWAIFIDIFLLIVLLISQFCFTILMIDLWLSGSPLLGSFMGSRYWVEIYWFVGSDLWGSWKSIVFVSSWKLNHKFDELLDKNLIVSLSATKGPPKIVENLNFHQNLLKI